MSIFPFKFSAVNQVNISNLDYLSALAREFPGRQKELFYKAYKFTNRFRNFVDNFNYYGSDRGAYNASVDGVIALATAFPGQLNKLFQLVLAQPNRMKELARNVSNIRALVAAFPAQRDKLFQLIFTEVDHFEALVQHNVFIFKQICAIFPEKKEALCCLLLTNRDYFDVTISSLSSLEELVEDCSSQRELLFQATVGDSVRFHNFIKKAHHLIRLAEIFPEHKSLLLKSTIEEVFYAIQSQSTKLEISKNVDMLYEISSLRSFHLPKDLVIYIAIMTGDVNFHRQFISLYHMTYECIKMAESRYDIIDHVRLAKEMMPSVSALIREHGLFMSVIRNNQQQPKTDQDQRNFDQQYALVVRNTF